MEFALAIYISIEIDKKSSVIQKISDDLGNYFKTKDYGDSIKSLIIGIVCVSPNFKQFFKPRKPKYTKDKKVLISQATNEKFEIEKCFEYDVEIDFESFRNISDNEAKKIIEKEIIKSLKVFEEMKLKIKDFNTAKFEEDLEHFFMKEN